MAKLSYGGSFYGSAWHMLRILGYHREYLEQKIKAQVELLKTEWLDFHFHQDGGDQELSGLEFLRNGTKSEKKAFKAWSDFWPQQGTPHHWDAIGKAIMSDGREEWLLVEAKAHIDELNTDCGAKAETSLTTIKKAFSETGKSLNITNIDSWLKDYYQYANRLAVLHFLIKHNVPARLLFIYFCGDTMSVSRICPTDEAGWFEALQKQDKHLSIQNSTGNLKNRIHRIFLNINGS